MVLTNSTTCLKEQRITVTGATGLLGSHLVAELLRTGCAVKLLLRDVRRLGQLYPTLQRMGVDVESAQLEFCEVELNNPHALYEALQDTEVLFHCAAQVSFDPEHHERILAANTEMTSHVVNGCLACGVDLLVHVSSIATLGVPPQGEVLITEECVLNSLVGRSSYSVSKVYAENMVRRGMAQGLRAIIVNPSILIGEGDWRTGSPKLIAFAAQSNFIYTQGVKGYVDVRDVARAMVLLAQTPEAVGERFIISSENLSFKTLFETVATVAGRRLPCLPLTRTMLNLLATLEKELCRVIHHKQLLSESFIANAVDHSQYSSAKLLRYIKFQFTPVRDALDRVTRQYREDKKR